MDQIASPDKPAYICYLIVIIVGLWVAYGKVNRLMASSLGRWAFLETWLVFLAYAVVPVLLFWILDYTNAIHDTAVFAALLVAVGYRQILAGEVKSAPVAGQFSALWSPFEAWGIQVRDRIVSKNKVRSDRFNEKLRIALSKTPAAVASLIELAYFVTVTPTDRAELTAALQAIDTEQRPAGITEEAFENIKARRRVELCMMSIRTAKPEDYGYLLRKRNLINIFQYALWIGDASTRVWRILGFVILTILLLGAVSLFRQSDNFLRYNLWRFQKPNATERDRFRTRNFVAQQINHQAGTAPLILDPLIQLLRYRDIDRRVAEDILAIPLEFRRPSLDERTIPMLIEVLRTENPDLRLRIHQTLQAMRTLAYKESPNDQDLAGWVPSKSDSPALVEEKIQRYRTWWDAPTRKNPPPAGTGQ